MTHGMRIGAVAALGALLLVAPTVMSGPGDATGTGLVLGTLAATAGGPSPSPQGRDAGEPAGETATTVPPATPGVTYSTFDGVAFRPDANDDGSSKYIVGGGISPAAYGWYAVRLDLPQAARVTELVWYVKDNSANNLALYLYSFDQSGVGGTSLAYAASSGASTAIQTLTASFTVPDVTVDNSKKSYLLYVLAPADLGLVLYGARLGYLDASPGNAVAAPVLAGSGQVGLPLTCTNAVWSRPPISVSTGWRRDGLVVAGQTGASFTPADADLGHALVCNQTATWGAGISLATTSNGVTVVPQLTGPTGPAGTAPIVAVFAPAALKARTGTSVRVVFAISARARVTLRLARRGVVLSATMTARAGTNAASLALRRGRTALPVGVYSLALRTSTGRTLTTTLLTVTR